MKTNLPGDFEQLAIATINDEATDVQLEALESAIMESDDGADVFRELAQRQALATFPSSGNAKAGLPLVVKRLLFGSVAAAAAIVTLVGAGVVYFQLSAGLAHQLQPATVATAATGSPGSTLSTAPVADNSDNLGGGELPLTTAVPEPSTSILLLSGATVLLLRRRR